MPHFIMDCSQNEVNQYGQQEIMQQPHSVAASSGLFAANDIKVRINSFTEYRVGNMERDFIHIFAHIMAGRTTEQKAILSRAMVAELMALFPKVDNIAMNVSDFDKQSYCNRDML